MKYYLFLTFLFSSRLMSQGIDLRIDPNFCSDEYGVNYLMQTGNIIIDNPCDTIIITSIQNHRLLLTEAKRAQDLTDLSVEFFDKSLDKYALLNQSFEELVGKYEELGITTTEGIQKTIDALDSKEDLKISQEMLRKSIDLQIEAQKNIRADIWDKIFIGLGGIAAGALVGIIAE